MTNDESSWRSVRLVVVDVEGNGRQPPGIIEIAIAAIEAGKISAPCEWLVRPSEPITRVVTRLHGITNAMVADAHPFEVIAPAVREYLRDDYLVAHNAAVELGVLTPLLNGWKPKGIVDTLRLAREFLPGRKSYSLSGLTRDLGLMTIDDGQKGPHRAGFDVRATAELFVHLACGDIGSERPLSSLLTPQSTAPVIPRQGSLF